MINVAGGAGGAGGGVFFFQAAAGRDINLAADDGFNAFFQRGLVEIDGAVEHAVVGEGEGGEFQGMRAVHQPVEAAPAIEERVLRM